MRATPTPLRIALLGRQSQPFACALNEALQALLPEPSRTLQCVHEATHAASADLRWLLGWEEDASPDPEAAMAALEEQNRWRQHLHPQAQDYQVLRGPMELRIAQALRSLVPWLPELGPLLPATGVASRRAGWSCSECSDPDCEHRSFTALLAGRPPDPTVSAT